MKSYQFQFSDKAENSFALFSRDLQARILKKLTFFENSENPLRFAKKLQNFENVFRFHIGDYRVLVKPKNKRELVILLILKVGHRREVYE